MRKRVLEVVNHVDKVGAAPTLGGPLGAARTLGSQVPSRPGITQLDIETLIEEVGWGHLGGGVSR